MSRGVWLIDSIESAHVHQGRMAGVPVVAVVACRSGLLNRDAAAGDGRCAG